MQDAAKLIGIILIAAICLGFGQPAKGLMVEESYTVKAGDTIWEISERFIEKSSYGPRDIREFGHGIIELNYDLFNERRPGQIYPGDELKIRYWIRED